jgi:menaquinone-specific isochorismate synthase
MTPSVAPPPPIKPARTLPEFFEYLRRALARHPSGPNQPNRLEADFPASFRFPFAQTDRLSLAPKFFWQTRHSSVRRLACSALISNSAPVWPPGWSPAPDDFLYGGQAFDPTHPSPSHDWKNYPTSFFFLPVLEIVESSSRTRLTLRWLDRSNLPALEALNALEDFLLRPPHHDETATPSALARLDAPNFHGWQQAIDRALQSPSWEKIVLARRSTFELSEDSLPFSLLQQLANHAPDCFHFLFSPTLAHDAFLGSSPELLYTRRHREIFTEAIAGTRPRNLDPAEDERMETELLHHPKERHEHQIVVDYLLTTLQSLCQEVSPALQPQILKLHRVQHLQTPLSGSLLPELSDSDILSRLHPTPATCGYPVTTARQGLRDLEIFPRGWYAGPIGIVGRDEATFCVALRSLRLHQSTLDAYAGAGIVPGSDAEKEWAELESKIGGILHILSP